MKLRFRNFKTTVVLHVVDDVGPSDVELLAVGIPKIARPDTPLIIDFEKSKFDPKVLDKITELREKLEEDFDCYFVSAVLSDAHTKTFEEALQKSENPNREIIVECLELEEKLQVLEKEEEKLLERVESNQTAYENAKKEREWLKFLMEHLDNSIKLDRELNAQFLSENPQENPNLETLKKDVLKLLSEKGVI